MKTETVLLRLTNNDRVIGQLLHIDKTTIALYAPMIINYDIDGDHLDITMFPYDPLSDTVMGIFELFHVLTYTIPKNSVIEMYEKHWRDFYSPLLETRQKLLSELKQKYGEENIFEEQSSSRKLH